ncbi:MAG: MFS transporter [Actinocatenispora sp.]
MLDGTMSPVESASAMDREVANSRYWPTLWRVIAGLIFDCLDIAIFGSLIPVFIAAGFLTKGSAAAIATVTFAGLLLGSVLQGPLTDWLGRRPLYQWNILIYGVATLATAFAPNEYVLGILRFISGLALGAEVPLAYSYAAEIVPRRTRGRDMALVNLIGGNIPFPLAVGVVLWLSGPIGWRGIFALIGVLSLLVLVARVRMPESDRWRRAKDRPPELEGTPARVGGLRRTLRDGIDLGRQYPNRLGGLMLGLFVSFVALYGLNTWLPTLLVGRGLDVAKSLTFTLVITMAFPVSSLLLALLLDRIGRRPIAISAFVLAAVFGLIFGNVHSDAAVLVVGFFMSLFVVTTANCMEVYAGEVFPTRARATGTGMAFGAARFGSVVASYIILGAFTAWGYAAVFVVLCVGLAIGALAVLWVRTEPKRRSLEHIAQ